MARQVLNWGLLGTARINGALIPPLRASTRNRLVAVASRDKTLAQAYAAERQIPRAFAGYDELLADPDIDAVYISLPNSLHCEWTVKAARAGKHVLCEKPISNTVEEVDRIIEAGRQTGVVIAEAFMYRHHAQTLAVKELIAGGAVGTLQFVRGAFTFNLTRPGDVRLSGDLGGGSIWDIGCYPISYSRFVVGSEPQSVTGWQSVGPGGVDELFAGEMRFANGVCAQFDCGFRGEERMLMDFVGTTGALKVTNPFKPGRSEELRILHSDGTQRKVDVAGGDLYSGEVEDLAAAVLDGVEQRISLTDSRANVATIQALLRAAWERVPISLE